MPAKLLTLLLSLPLLLTVCVADAAPPKRSAEAEAAFVDKVNREYGVPKDVLRKGLADARYQQSIIDAITRPAEAMPWSKYRPIFMNDKRIQGGRDFLRENRELLLSVERDTGVPASIIVAIIGVETNYGAITGKYRVLDALYTLGFHYPKRADFFRSELGHLFALANEEHVDPNSVMGSYAGAMGWGQFMPSSYRAYAKDGDGDGHRDLWTSKDDVFRSIANYFVAHHWRAGEPVAEPAVRGRGRDQLRQQEPQAGAGPGKAWRAGLPAEGGHGQGLASQPDHAGWRRRSRVLDHLPQFLRDFALQPLAAVFVGGVPAGAGHCRGRCRQ